MLRISFLLCLFLVAHASLTDFSRSFEQALTKASTHGFLEGVAIRDLNGDGLPDVVLCNSPSRSGPESQIPPGNATNMRLLLNSPDGLIDASDKLPRISCMSVTVGDIDNDGDADLIATLPGNPGSCHVVLNDKGTFRLLDGAISKCPAFAGAPTLGDLNGDGKLDLVIPAIGPFAPSPIIESVVYTGRGNGHFDSLPNTGMERSEFPCGATIIDFDGDGDQDVVVLGCNKLESKNSTLIPIATPLYMYRNSFKQTGKLKFTNDVVALTGYQPMGFWMNTAVCDFNNDGIIDFYFGNSGRVSGAKGRHLLLMGNGDGTYRDESDAAGVAVERFNWGGTCLDLQNDGYQDLITVGALPQFGSSLEDFSPGAMFANNRGCFPLRLTDEYGIFYGSGLAKGDLNGDGIEDIVIQQSKFGQPPANGNSEAIAVTYKPVVTLFGRNQFVKVTLKGAKSNRDAIGAKVTVEWSSVECGLVNSCHCRRKRHRQVQVIISGSSAFSSHDNVLTFGLGAKPRIHRITVVYPSGRVQVIYVPKWRSHIMVNQNVRLVEPRF